MITLLYIVGATIFLTLCYFLSITLDDFLFGPRDRSWKKYQTNKWFRKTESGIYTRTLTTEEMDKRPGTYVSIDPAKEGEDCSVKHIVEKEE